MKSGSLTTWFLVLALIAAAVGGLWLADRRDDERAVAVATAAVDAFAVVDHVAVQFVAREDVPADPVEVVEDTEGRYAVRSVNAGDALSKDDLGPQRRSDSEVVVPVPLESGRSPDLREGEVADLLLAPSVASVDASVVRDVLVVHVSDDSQRIAYLAMRRSAEKRVAAVLARGDAVIAVQP